MKDIYNQSEAEIKALIPYIDVSFQSDYIKIEFIRAKKYYNWRVSQDGDEVAGIEAVKSSYGNAMGDYVLDAIKIQL